ncbi:RhuM family protein [Caminibacter mediatlanticus]|uniref:Probable Death-on-curing family protein n=1 Tax=Caminibacter mediatlanticus TB-2 TaxID=391592 RepID=A0AAI9AHJ0_9BACT|nr:RhuM family protein [Caminibacter mediatlanticus]EDM24311.1 probable Death-on-curing family protein [Caminibacter mediatlanticus TB-2]
MNEIIKFIDGEIEVDVRFDGNTIWLRQDEIAKIFGKDRSVITRHINNIFKDKEVDRDSNVQKMHFANSDKPVKLYSLDIVLAVGYRTNSAKAIKFRQWATKVLKDYILKGYALNQKRLKNNFEEFQKEIELLQKTIKNQNLNEIEAKGFLDIITKYAKSWILLNQFDEQKLNIPKGKETKFILDYDEAKEEIEKLKQDLILKKEATNLFGMERENSFKGILRNIYQTFSGVDLLPTIEEKAANLFYYIVKDHPFVDGNKRIGAFLFILFLSKNNYLYDKNGDIKINSNALVSLALLIAHSNPKEKDLIIKLIMNLISDE